MAENRTYDTPFGSPAPADAAVDDRPAYQPARPVDGPAIPIPRTRQLIEAVWAEHELILRLAALYIVTGGLLLTVLGRAWPLHLMTRWFAVVWLSGSSAWLAWQWIRHPKRFWAALAPPRLLGAILIFLIVVPVQVTFQSLKQSIGPVVGFTWDAPLSRMDLVLHGGTAWASYAAVVPLLAHLKLIDWLYQCWFLGLVLFLLWASWTRHRALRGRAIVAFLLLWIIGGTVIAALFASVGPCYYPHVVDGDGTYGPLLSHLSEHGPMFATTNQRTLWEFRTADGWKHFGGISAFPSMHVAAAVLWTIIAWQRSKVAALVLGAYALAIQIGSVALGWHYAIDGYAGAVIAWGCWWGAGRLRRRP